MTTSSGPCTGYRTRRSRPAAALAAAAALVLASGCSGSNSPAPPSTTASGPSSTIPTPTTSAARTGVPRSGLPAANRVDGTRPEAVAAWVLTAWYGYDTVLDASPSDAARRALPWLTPTLAAIDTQAAPVAAPGATWTRWTQARAYATVRLTPSGEDHPPDTALLAFRAYQVDLTLHPAQPASSSDHVIAFVQLVRADLHSPWRVEEVNTR